MIASLIRFCGDFGLAEDAVQEAFIIASRHWARDGLPPNPGGWIATTAKRQLIDRLRSERSREEREKVVAIEAVRSDLVDHDDDRLRLVFTCCHPALALDVQVALTLRTVSGLATDRIAAAFLVPEATMAKRLTRGRRKIKVAGIPYEVPTPDNLGRRLPAVLAVIYLVFTTGYDAVGRHDANSTHLVGEAMRLGEGLKALMPNEPEITGLLALMLFHDARSESRTHDGRMVRFHDQDRSEWDQRQIDEAMHLVSLAPQHGAVGQYWLQAAIAAEHIGPASAAEKDWHRIVTLYDRLLDLSRGSPVIGLNRAIALGEADGPIAGLAALEPLAEALRSYPYLHIAVGDFNKRSGDNKAAAVAYRRALRLPISDLQKAAIHDQLKEIEEIL